MADLRDKEKDGRYYREFDEHLMLREVVIGVRCETSQQDVVAIRDRRAVRQTNAN
jgi:hypothetical protein